MAGSVSLRAIESDALIEPSFRRLLASIEGERDRIRGTWQQIQQEREERTAELEHLRQSTEDWCLSERSKISDEWTRLDSLTEKIGDLWPEETEIIDINCCGSIFTIARSSLCSIEGSVLSNLFSDKFINEVPRDEAGRFYLDFNPACFAIVIQYLQNRRLRIDAPVPLIPIEQRHNMELMAEAWKLSPFLRENKINPVHTTSLLVRKDTVQSTHPGWQVISAQHPLPMAGPSYFEVTVVKNPDPRGGLAVGVCGHIPLGSEVHSLRLKGSILYNSNNGLIGDSYEPEKSDMPDKIQLVQGSTFGIQHDVSTHSLLFYVNRTCIGKAYIKQGNLGLMRTLYPVFALYVTDLLISVDFSSPSPSTVGAPQKDARAGNTSSTEGTGTHPGRLAPPALQTTVEGDEEDDEFDS